MKLYKQLKKLADNEDLGFYSTKQELINGMFTVEIFSYRLCSWSDFELPGALESRGITYIIAKHGKPIEPILICRPFHKFFNLGEGGKTLDEYINKNNESKVLIMTKEDGSLISFVKISPGVFLAKSKNSFYSDQAEAANQLYLNNHNIQDIVHELIKERYTPLFEYVAPDNQIVLKYNEPRLILLGARNIDTGKYMDYEELYNRFETNKNDMTENKDLVKIHDTTKYGIKNYLENLVNEEYIEGVVVAIGDFIRFKLKTGWYCTRHRLKDSLNTEYKYVEAIVNEEMDDIVGLFGEQLFDMEYVENLQKKIVKEYNMMVKNVENFYEENKDLSRKDYAIKMSIILPDFKAAIMTKYNGDEPDYKNMYLKLYKSKRKNEE